MFEIWNQAQFRDLTTEKVTEEHLALFQIKQHYERQNLDPPTELLVDLELLIRKIKTQFGLSLSQGDIQQHIFSLRHLDLLHVIQTEAK